MRPSLRRAVAAACYACFGFACEPSEFESAESSTFVTTLLNEEPTHYDITVSASGASTDLTVSKLHIVSENVSGAAEQHVLLSLECSDGALESRERGILEDLGDSDFLIETSFTENVPFEITCDLSFVTSDASAGPIEITWHAYGQFVWESKSKPRFEIEATEA